MFFPASPSSGKGIQLINYFMDLQLCLSALTTQGTDLDGPDLEA